MRQIVGLAATELQRERVLLVVETQMARHVAMDERAGRHHLGVEQRAAGEQSVEETAVAVRPVHHRGYRDTHVANQLIYKDFIDLPIFEVGRVQAKGALGVRTKSLVGMRTP